MSDHLQKVTAAMSLFRSLKDPQRPAGDGAADARLEAADARIDALGEAVEALVEALLEQEKRLADAHAVGTDAATT